MVKHVILLENDEIVQMDHYYPDTDKSHWIYKCKRISDNLFEVEREDVKGGKINYTVAATRNSTGKVSSYLIRFLNYSQTAILEYNAGGWLVKECIGCPENPQEEGILEYEYDERGNIVGQKVFGKNL